MMVFKVYEEFEEIEHHYIENWLNNEDIINFSKRY